MRGSIKSYFPGGNTPDGYFSFFERVISWPSARRILIIKGGPGVGKSTFMKRIARELLKEGLKLELLHCSADTNSLDGLVVPDFKIALLDGTAPHMMDPKFPGCVDEIINLGDYWDEEGIKRGKERILELQREYSRCYTRAYNYLKAARVIHDDLEDIYINATNFRLVDAKTQEILEMVFKDSPAFEKRSLERHMFASAITPDGLVHYLASIFRGVEKRFVVSGYPGTGKATFMKRVLEKALLKGLDVEVFHCAMNPEKIEHIIIKDLNVGFVTSVKPHMISGLKENDQIIDMNFAVDPEKIKAYEEHVNFNETLFWNLIDSAVKTLKDAKKIHEHVERLYVSNMNFERLDIIREQTLSRILKYIYAESYM
jgi:DNA polymerase III delta prime subunit